MTFLVLSVVVAAVVVTALRRALPAVAVLAWFGVVYGLAASGVLGAFERMPPKIPLVALSAVGIALLVSRVAAVKEALRVMPSWWPVAFQTFRAPLEVALYLLFTAGQLPEQMTFAGRNFDVLVGVSAPVMAFLIATKRAPPWVQWLWQLAAVGLLINVVSIAITSAPGPLHLDWPGAPLTIVAQWPYALLPGFLVPCAVLGHVLAISKLRGNAQQE